MRRRLCLAARPGPLACLLACFAIGYPADASYANGEKTAVVQTAKEKKEETKAENEGKAAAAAPADSKDAPATGASSQPVPKRDASSLPTDKFCELVATVAQQFRLPVNFFANLLWQESRFNYTAVSSAGAQGVAQFMPAVAEAMKLENPFNPIEAVPASASLLNELRSQFGNLGLAAAAYNAGPKRVIDWRVKRSRLPKETRDYVEIITGLPVEKWRKAGANMLAFRAAPRMPCTKNVEFAKLQAEEAPEENKARGASPKAGVRAAAKGRQKKQQKKPATARVTREAEAKEKRSASPRSSRG